MRDLFCFVALEGFYRKSIHVYKKEGYSPARDLENVRAICALLLSIALRFAVCRELSTDLNPRKLPKSGAEIKSCWNLIHLSAAGVPRSLKRTGGDFSSFLRCQTQIQKGRETNELQPIDAAGLK